MRQGQQNRRGRGRNNNNNNNNSNGGNNHNNGARKGQNPLARSFESSGPDVKLRGTPAHIAEKYMALARDAQSSGDPVLAENYLQHAEHYNRIILAYREQQIAQGASDPGTAGVARTRAQFGDSTDTGDIGDEDGDDQGSMMPGGMQQPPPVGFGEQPPMANPPRFEGGGGQRFEGRPQRDHRQDHQPRGDVPRYPPRDRQQGDARGGFQERGDRPMRQDRPDRPERMDRPQRPERMERPDRPERFDRPERAERADRPERIDRPEPIERGERMDRPVERPERIDRPDQRPERAAPVPQDQLAGDAPPRRRERFQPPAGLQNDQPEFLRRPVRRPRREESSEAAPDVAPATVVDDQE